MRVIGLIASAPGAIDLGERDRALTVFSEQVEGGPLLWFRRVEDEEDPGVKVYHQVGGWVPFAPAEPHAPEFVDRVGCIICAI